MHYVCFCDNCSAVWALDEENLHFMLDSKVVHFKWRFVWNTESYPFSEYLFWARNYFIQGAAFPLSATHVSPACSHVLWKLTKSLPKSGTVWEGFPPNRGGSCGWTGCREARERPGRDMALTKRWSNLPEQDDSLFPYFGCAFLVLSGFAYTPW